MRPRPILFAKASHPAEPSPGQSGGRGQESPPPAAVSDTVAGGILPIDTIPQCKAVTLHFEKAKPLTGFLDPVYGFMDAAGVQLPAAPAPTGWSK